MRRRNWSLLHWFWLNLSLRLNRSWGFLFWLSLLLLLGELHQRLGLELLKLLWNVLVRFILRYLLLRLSVLNYFTSLSIHSCQRFIRLKVIHCLKFRSFCLFLLNFFCLFFNFLFNFDFLFRLNNRFDR